MSTKVTALLAAVVFAVGFGGTIAAATLVRGRTDDGLPLRDPVRLQTERMNERLERGERVSGLGPITTRVDEKFEPFDPNKPRPTPPPEAEHALTHEGKTRVATFESAAHTHVLCRKSYVDDAIKYQITEYTDTEWAEENDASLKQWMKSGCSKAEEASSRLLDSYDATDLSTDAMPDLPRYRDQKSIRKTMVAQSRDDFRQQKAEFARRKAELASRR